MVHTDGTPTIACAVRGPDITVRDEGSIVLLDGGTSEGRTWLDESLDPEAQRWGSAYVVEPRYVSDILDGALCEGLAVGAS
jgi:hypothetical protein